MPKQKTHTAEKYISDVLLGKIPACKYVKECFQRHENDLKNSSKNGYVFNPDFSKFVIKFFSFLKHYKGAYSGRPFILEPWQQAIVWVVFGWRVGNFKGPRRFRQVYIEIPKKNGKTAFAAGLSLYLAFFDGESAAEVYTAATKRDQAKLCFDDIKNFIKGNPALSNKLKVHTNNISHGRSSSKIEPLSNDHGTSDGINISAAVIDEVHRHKDADLINLINSSTSAREQPLVFEITTAGTNKQSVCYDHREYTIQVNKNRKKDNQWFGIIFTFDEGDSWKVTDKWFKQNPGKVPPSWLKANPNLGTGKSLDYLKDQVVKARNRPSFENTVKRYEFNLWVGSEQKWISEDKWEATVAYKTDEELTGENVTCYGALDCASVSDFNALTLLFEHPEWIHFKYFFWCPEERLNERVEKLSINFHEWVSKGFVFLIPGNVVDVNSLADGVIYQCQKYRVHSVAYDKYLAHHGTVQKMMENDIECVEQSQAITSMSYPTKETEKLIIGKKATHEDNPAMSWQMGNVLIYEDANENVKIHKGKSQDKVDGPVSKVMSVAQYLDCTFDNDDEDSAYNNEGFF